MENGEHLNYSLALGDPWFLGERRPVSLKLSNHVSESPEGDYERHFKSVGINWRRYFDRQFSVAFHPYLSELRIRDHRVDPEVVTVNPKGLDVIAGCSVSLDVNTTDVFLRPRRGIHAKARIDGFGLAGSNQPEGLAFDAELAWFRQAPVATCGILGLRMGLGVTTGRRGDYMKRYLGGSRRVRAGLPGDWPGWSQGFMSAEFRLPLVDRRLYFKHIDLGLGFVLFADGGLSWKEEFHGSSLAAGGVGMGLRVFAPFIEVGRLDVAWNPESGITIFAARGHAF
jgi:outer membrane protein assembly factor BamA